MEEEYIENSKPLGKLILLVAFTAIMLITSTYAWFSTQKNVSLSNLYGAVNVAEGLQMSLDASVWVNEINFSDFDQTTSSWTIKPEVSSTKYFNAATTNPSFQYPAGSGGGITNVIPDEYLPVSTTGLAGTNDGIGQLTLKMYAGDVVNNNTDLQNVDQLAEDADSGYFAFDLFLMNTSASTVTADILRLDVNSTITADNAGTGIENSARVAFALYENINDDATKFVDYRGIDGIPGTEDDRRTGKDMTISGNNILTQAQIIQGTSTGKVIKDIAIWEPNANAHTTTIVNTNNKLQLTTEDIGMYNNLTSSIFIETDYLPTYGLTSNSKTKYSEDTANPKALYEIYNWTEAGLEKTGFAKQHTLQTSSVASEFATSINLKSVKKLEADVLATDTTFTIEPNQYQKMRVYVWIEGQDPDCINVASLGGGITLDIGFSKEGTEVLLTEPSDITEITLDNTTAEVQIGRTFTLRSTINENAEDSVTWVSSDAEIAVVEGIGENMATGIVTPVSEGTAIITAKNSDETKLKTCLVTVDGVYELPSTEETKPYLPTAFTYAGGDLSTGLIIQDAKLNQYVWVEVPRNLTTYPTANLNITEFSDTDYTNIEKDLHTYTSIYRNDNYNDIWDSEGSQGFESTDEYNGLKQKMLKSVYQNGGFYIGRYEAGSAIDRIGHTVISDTLVPESKENQYPLTNVYCREAQTLASRVLPAGSEYTSSLMFGVQWDLVLKYLETKNVVTQEELTESSSSWGNCATSIFTLNRGKYTVPANSLKEWNEYTTDLNGVVVDSAAVSRRRKYFLYTTGASDQNMKQNIYDLAGNVYEFTLESNHFWGYAVTRGGSYASLVNRKPPGASFRATTGKNNNSNSNGFRVTIY